MGFFTTNNHSSDAGLHARLLPEFYYLDNFHTLINSVYHRYDDVLSCEERNYYHNFRACERDAQALYARLLMRRADVFRVSKLKYTELKNLDRAIEALCQSGLLILADTCSLDALFPLYTRAEWQRLMGPLKTKGVNKHVLYPLIKARYGDTISTFSLFNENIIQVQGRKLFAVFRRLYFSNDSQSLADFILRDLGLFQYEPYKLDKTTRLFENRQQIESVQTYYELREMLENAETVDDAGLDEIVSLLPKIHPLRVCNSFSERAIARRLQKLAIKLARHYERLKSFNKALSLYAQCCIAPATERQIRILYKMQKYADAEKLCKQLSVSGSEAEKLFAQSFFPGIEKKLKKNPAVNTPVAKRFLERRCNLKLLRNDSVVVEEQVARYFKKNGECYYIENTLFPGVFGLLFWPVIFAEVRGAFSHAFQNAPHDLYQEDFAGARSELLEEAWARLPDWCASPKLACDDYEQHKGKANALIHWQLFSPELLERALQRIPLQDWQGIFKRLWQDLRENRSGFPDLIYFPRDGSYCLLEVKAPGDRLQANQKRWLQYFERTAVPYEVVYVEWHST